MCEENQTDRTNRTKVQICCGDSADLCKDVSCKVEEIENGITFSITSDDPEKVEKLKAKMKSCCGSSDSECSC